MSKMLYNTSFNQRPIDLDYDLKTRIENEPFENIVNDAVKKIYDKYGLYINDDGLSKTITNYNTWNLNAIKQSLYVINMFLTKKYSKNMNHSSYGLKHNVEGFLQHKYISNGNFIIAMIILGFVLYPIENSLNCYFDIKFDYQAFVYMKKWINIIKVF